MPEAFLISGDDDYYIGIALRDTGAYSCTGTCFDIGFATRAALERFRRTGEPLAGSADPAASGNGLNDAAGQ